MRKLSIATMAALSMAAAASMAGAYDGILLESFENGLGVFQVENNGSNISTGATSTTLGVTNGTHSLLGQSSTGFTLMYKQFDYNLHEKLLDGGVLTVDATIQPGSFAGSTYSEVIMAAAGDQDNDGVSEYGFKLALTAVPIDGSVVRCSFTINDDAHQIQHITGGYWGTWLGINVSGTAGPGTVTFDNYRYVANGSFTNNAGGNWSDDANWIGGAPNGVNKPTTFAESASNAAAISVAVDNDFTVGKLNFNGTTAYTLTGTHTLTLQRDDGIWPELRSDAGSHRIDAPIYLANDGTNIYVAAGSTLSVNSISKNNSEAFGGYSNKYDAGTLQVDHWNTGGVTIFGGTIAFHTDTLPRTSTPFVNIMQGFFIIANDGGALGSRVYNGTLDVGTSDMVLRGFGGTDSADKLANLSDMARAGQNGAVLFGGNGIVSSVAKADANGQLRYAVGVIQNSIDGSPIYATFDGVSVGTGDILVKFTYFGDADLNGVVDDTDFFLINNGYGNGLTGWVNGDFDYSGTVDDTDFFLINNAYGLQGSALRAGGAVPEPTGMGVLALAGGMLLGRRRK